MLGLLRLNWTNRQIAEHLGISPAGARYHVSEIIAKLGVKNRREAASWRGSKERRWSWLLGLPANLRELRPGAVFKVAGSGASIAAGVFLVALAAGVATMKAREVPDASADGRLAFVQGGNLWVMTLPHGTPVQLTTTGNAWSPRWSPFGEWLLVDLPDAQSEGRTVLRFDGTDRHEAPGCTAWSPVADELVCTTDDGLVVQSSNGSSTRILDGDGANFPRWSLDGTMIAYAKDGVLTPSPHDLTASKGKEVPGSRSSALWVVNADGTNRRQVFENDGYSPEGGQVILADWSATSVAVYFFLNPWFASSAPLDGLPLNELRLADAATRDLDVFMLTVGDFMAPPQPGKPLLITEGSARMTWTSKRMATLDPATGKLVPLTSQAEAAFSPAWSPDGTRIAYSTGPDFGKDVGGGDEAKIAASQRHIWAMDGDGSNPLQITTDDAYRDEGPVWSSDGESILFTRIGNSPEGSGPSLWIVSSSGGAPTRLTDISAVASDLQPDVPFWFGYYGYIDWDRYFAVWWPGGG